MSTKQKKPHATKNTIANSIDAATYVRKLLGGKKLTLPRFVKAIRKGEEMTLQEFATLLGTTRQNLHSFEKGIRPISVAKAVEWAGKLGYSEQQFIELALQDLLGREGVTNYDVLLNAHHSAHDGRPS